MGIEKVFCLLLIFTLLEVVVKTQTSKNGAGGSTRDFNLQQHDIHRYHLIVDNNLMLDASDNGGIAGGSELINEANLKSLKFHPTLLNFRENPVGDPKNIQVTLFNHHKNQSVVLGLISGKTPDFYSSFFEDKIVPPGGNTTFNVVFLPRHHGPIDGALSIHTSFGLIKYELKGEGIECPYRLTPLVGLKVPFNATLTPEISMYNPHNIPLQIVEVFSSGGNFHLELPSGGQEGPQILWEIPPYCTKPIIRLKFTANIPGNHTAYVRIKITGNDPSLADRILVVPIEVEIVQETGIYSAMSLLDFGLIGSNDAPVKYRINLENSGNLNYRINNLSVESADKNVIKCITLKYNSGDNLIHLKTDWSTLENAAYINGSILINSTLNSYRLPFIGNIIKGGIEFSDQATQFVTSAKSYTARLTNEFILKNNFNIPLAVTNITVPDDFSDYFMLSDMLVLSKSNNYHVTIKPGDSRKLFKISEQQPAKQKKPVSAQSLQLPILSQVKIKTNITDYQIPVVKTTGLLKRIVPVENEGCHGVDEKILNFGTLPVSKSSDMIIALVNENPVPVQLTNWKGVISASSTSSSGSSSGTLLTIMLRGCSELTMKELLFCNVINPGEWVLFQVSVQSSQVGQFHGKFTVQTNYEEIVTPVKFNVAMGRLELDGDLLHFKNCFPDRQCLLNLSAHSTFLKKMKVEKISVDVPGITYEHMTTNNFPEISPNVITDIGRLFFDSKELCEADETCYTGLQLTNDDWKQSLIEYRTSKLDFEILATKLQNFDRMRSQIKSISFRLITNQIRRYDFNASVDFVWPRLIMDTVNFPVLQVGHEVIKFITLTNPSDELLVLHYVLHDARHGLEFNEMSGRILSDCSNCSLSADPVFSFPDEKQYRYNDYVNPRSSVKIALIFSAMTPGTYSTVLYIRNNLTVIEGVWVTAKAVQPQFKFANRKSGSPTALQFEISDKNLRDCDRRVPENGSNSISLLNPMVKRTFTAKNIGEVPIVIGGIRIGGSLCEGYGFKVVDCSPFELQPNGSRKLEIAFTPDFTLARVKQILEMETSMGYSVNYTLLSTIPPQSLGPCGKALLRPDWEATLKIFSAAVLSLILVAVLIGAFLDSDRVLKDHVNNLSRERGPIQPPLDLRQISFKPSTIEEPATSTTKLDSWSGNHNSNKKKSSDCIKRKAHNNMASSGGDEIIYKSKWTTDITNKLSNMKNQMAGNSINSTAASNKSRRSMTPPNKSPVHQKKDINKKSFNTNRDSNHHSEEETSSTTTEESSFNSEESLSSLDGKISSSSSSSSTTSLSAQLNLSEFKTENLNLINATMDSHTGKTKQNKVSVKKTRSLPTNYEPKEHHHHHNHHGGEHGKLGKLNKSNDRSSSGTNASNLCGGNSNSSNKTQNTRNNASSPSNHSSSDSNSGISNSNQGYSNSTEIKKNNKSQRKGGKTPGRERKNALNSKKSMAKTAADMKETTAFDFNPLMSTNTSYPANTASIWDENRASFSYVVAQNPKSTVVNPDPAIPPNYNNNKRSKMSAANVAQALLSERNRVGKMETVASPPMKPDEFCDDLIDDKRAPIDLGPIGTRKSPSSTPVWEPMPSAIKRPTPTPLNSLFGDMFPQSNPIFSNSYMDYPRNAQNYQSNTRPKPAYMNNSNNGGGLNNNHSANQQHWDSGAMLLSLLQRGSNNNDTDNLHLNGWGSSGLWAPVDHPVSPSATGWPQGPLRPPPGLSLIRDRNPNLENSQAQLLQQQQQQQQQQQHQIPQFDPFTSLSSIWSPPESWTSPSDASRPNSNHQQQHNNKNEF